MSRPLDWLHEHAARRRDDGLRRELRPRGPDEALVDLAGNDYLGLARDERVIAAGVAALRRWGAGSTGSRLVTGSTTLHAELEEALAAFCGADAALVFSSGYTANLGVVTALSGPGALVVSDAGNHASLVDACRLSRARVVVTPRADPAAVDDALAARTERRALVVTDGIDSTDGTAAPLRALHAVCRARGAVLVVDEAHALGVHGPGGRGGLAAAGLAGADDVVATVTLSKALGSQGGAVLGPRAVVDHLVDTARTFVFDTGLAPAGAGAARAALAVLAADPGLPAATLRVAAALAASVRAADAACTGGPGAVGAGAHRVGTPAPGSGTGGAGAGRAGGTAAAVPESAVVPVVLGAPEVAVAAARACRERGLLVGCFRPPSVPEGTSRLRLTARADLGTDDLTLALDVLGEVLAGVPV